MASARRIAESVAGHLRPIAAEWPQWRGATVVCIATGPSITAQQINTVRAARDAGRVRVIAINDMGLSYRLGADLQPSPTAPWADVWYAADARFWEYHANFVPDSSSLRLCAEQWAVDAGLCHLHVKCHLAQDALTLAYVPGHVLHGMHSGIQALQVALAAKVSRVLLLGYDCNAPASGHSNYFGRKAQELDKHTHHYDAWVAQYRALPLPPWGAVINCTPGSAIDCYPRATLAEALA
jgi:hypothetical protein